MKSQLHKDNSSFRAVFLIYFVTVAIAATAIIPIEETLTSGIIKSFVWPFYVITKVG